MLFLFYTSEKRLSTADSRQKQPHKTNHKNVILLPCEYQPPAAAVFRQSHDTPARYDKYR